MATFLDLEDARKVCYRFLDIPAESRFILRVDYGNGELAERHAGRHSQNGDSSHPRLWYKRFSVGIDTLSEKCGELYAVFVQMRLTGKQLPMTLVCMNVYGDPCILEEDPEDFLSPVTRTGRLSGKVPSYGGVAGRKRALVNLRMKSE